MGRTQRSAAGGRLSALLFENMALQKTLGFCRLVSGGDANVVARLFLFNFPDFLSRKVFPGRRSSLSSC